MKNLWYFDYRLMMCSTDVFLCASFKEPNQTVIMHHTDPSRTQTLSLQLVEKVI
jgi:hypothetical protein